MDEPDNRCTDREMVQALGWKVYEAPLTNPYEDRWLVFLTRGEQRIMARAPTPELSWSLAASMVEDLDCNENQH